MKEKDLSKESHKVLIKKIKTTSMNKLEKMVKEDDENKYIIAAFCYYARRDKINSISHPNLFDVTNKYEVAISKTDKSDDPFYQVYDFLSELYHARESKKNLKIKIADEINTILKESKNISINMLANKSKIKYSNLYNFLVNKVYSNISIRNIVKVYWITLASELGLTDEEAHTKHMEMLEKIKESWPEE